LATEGDVGDQGRRLCVLVWTAALVLGANSVFPLEWSHPYCNNPTDGPAWAAYGLPLPYRQFSGVSSLTFNIMPDVLLLNVALLAALAYPFARMADRRLARAGRVTSAVTAIPGILLLLLSPRYGSTLHSASTPPTRSAQATIAIGAIARSASALAVTARIARHPNSGSAP
jgi:hypothetical protein